MAKPPRPTRGQRPTTPALAVTPALATEATTAAAAPTAAAIPGLLGAEDLSTDRQFATNLARGLAVLRAFTADDPMLGNRDIVDRTGLPKATVSRLTYTLTLLGYLTRVSAGQKYRLGSGVLSLGHPLLASMAVRQVARPLMEQIARETGCTVNLGMRDRLSVVYVDSCRVDPGNSYQPDIGSTRPLLSTSIGRALLLAAAPAQRSAILNRLKLADPLRFAQDLPLLDGDDARFRQSGYCYSQGDWRADVHAVAVPIRQNDEGLALNCTWTLDRLRPLQPAAALVPRLLDAAQRIARATGCP